MFVRYFFLIIIALAVISCGDNTTEPVEEAHEYLPLSLGNYWIFDSYSLNSDLSKIPGTEGRDSLVVLSQVNIAGRDAYLIVKFTDDSAVDSLYIMQNDEAVYLLQDSSGAMIPGMNYKWFKIADFKTLAGHEWHIFDTTLYNYPFVLENEEVLSTYHHTLNGTNEYEDYFEIDSIRARLKGFKNKHDSKLYFNYRFPDSLPNDSVEVNWLWLHYWHYWFAEDIGFVKIQFDPYSVKLFTIPETKKWPYVGISGRTSNLIKYHILR